MSKYPLASLAIALLLTGCASNPSPSTDPYPGSGGLFLGTPSQADVQSGRSVFTPGKIDFAKVGVTSKQDVVKTLGPPAWWQTKKDGTSTMGYDFVEVSGFMGMRKVVRASFTFSANLVLAAIDKPQ